MRAHLAGRDDGLVSVRPLLDRAPRFADLIEGEADGAAFAPLRRSELIGRPLGSPNFVAEIEKRLKRRLAPGKRGRKPRQEGSAEANKVKTVVSRSFLVSRAQEWPHSSVRAHLAGRDDGLVSVRPLLDRAPRFADLIEGEADGAAFAPLRRSELIGRPLGSPNFVAEIEKRLKRRLAPGKRGRKPRQEGGSAEANKVKTVVSP